MVNLRAGSAAYRLLRQPKNPVSRTNLQKNDDIINHLSQKLNAGQPTNLLLPVRTGPILEIEQAGNQRLKTAEGMSRANRNKM